MLTEYVQKQGWEVVDTYIDDGFSGTNFDRPGFQRMIADIEKGRINLVITKDLSRLGRNYIMCGRYTEIYFPGAMCATLPERTQAPREPARSTTGARSVSPSASRTARASTRRSRR